jgi:hypothetical protein
VCVYVCVCTCAVTTAPPVFESREALAALVADFSYGKLKELAAAARALARYVDDLEGELEAADDAVVDLRREVRSRTHISWASPYIRARAHHRTVVTQCIGRRSAPAAWLCRRVASRPIPCAHVRL